MSYEKLMFCIFHAKTTISTIHHCQYIAQQICEDGYLFLIPYLLAKILTAFRIGGLAFQRIFKTKILSCKTVLAQKRIFLKEDYCKVTIRLKQGYPQVTQNYPKIIICIPLEIVHPSWAIQSHPVTYM